MRKMNVVVLVLMSLVVSACKIQIDVPAGAGGSVDTVSGAYSCAVGESCQIDVVDIFFDEEFVGTPNPTYFFMEWVEKSRSFCANITVGCRLYTSFFGGVPIFEAFLDAPDEIFFIEPHFATATAKFSVAELRSGTLYAVALVGGGDDAEDFAEVVSLNFSNSDTVAFQELLNNAFSGSTTFAVTKEGFLYFEGDSSANYRICKTTDDYLTTIRTEDGEVDNIELFFFEEKAALDYASTLTEENPVPRC
jgi:hypothetical protein